MFRINDVGRTECGPNGLPAGIQPSDDLSLTAGVQKGGPAGAPTNTAGSTTQSSDGSGGIDAALHSFTDANGPIRLPKWEDVK